MVTSIFISNCDSWRPNEIWISFGSHSDLLGMGNDRFQRCLRGCWRVPERSQWDSLGNRLDPESKIYINMYTVVIKEI